MTTRITIAIIAAAIVLTIDVLTDYKKWLRDRNIIKPKGSVNHTLGLVLVVIGLIPSAWLSGYVVFPVIAFGYWIFKNWLLNLLMGEAWGRIGTTSSIDKLMLKYPILKFAPYLGLILSMIWLKYHL
jgi:hypothetical protein